MIARRTVAALALATVFAAAAPSLAQSTAQGSAASMSGSGSIATRPARGLVPLRIDVTQPRRVMVRDAASHALHEVCTTPCRIFVEPGRVDVTLVGWGAHEYHWDVPEQGGSIHLLARLPSGQLDAMPTEAAPSNAVAQSVPTASARELAVARVSAAFGIGACTAAVTAVAHGVAMLDLSNQPST